MLDLCDLCLELRNVLFRHILHNNEGERPFAEILHQLVLPDDGIHIVRQIVEHIIIDPRRCHAEYRWDHQHYREDQNGNAVFYDRFGKSHKLNRPFTLFFVAGFRVDHIRLLVANDLYRADHDAQIENSLRQQRHAEQCGQKHRAFPRAEDQQKPNDRR